MLPLESVVRLLRSSVLRLVRVVTFVAVAGVVSCGGPEPVDLDVLVIRDSLYVEPGSGMPYTGPVFRDFPDGGEGPQLEGALREGEWHGEIRVYHPNGRIRYLGSFDMGSMCGPWTENADSTAGQSVYEELLDEIESLGMYPPCPEI